MFIPEIPEHAIDTFVAELAKTHGIVASRTANDALAETITSLSGDEVVTDATEDLIVALRRNDVIDGATMVSLLGRYFKERRRLDLRGDPLEADSQKWLQRVADTDGWK